MPFLQEFRSELLRSAACRRNSFAGIAIACCRQEAICDQLFRDAEAIDR